MQHEVLLAAGAIDIPKGFAGEVFGGVVVLRSLGTDGEVGVLKVRLGFRGIAMYLLQEVTVGAFGAFAAVAHAFLQRTLADGTHAVAVGAFDALCAATEAVDTRGGDVHMVPFAPLAGDLLTQRVVVVYGGGSGVATGAVETAKGYKRCHSLFDFYDRFAV